MQSVTGLSAHAALVGIASQVGSSCAGNSTIYSKLQRDESHYPVRIARYVLAYLVFRSPEIRGKRMYDSAKQLYGDEQHERDQYAGKTTGTCDKSLKLREGYDT
jgi:hypothetical protein